MTRRHLDTEQDTDVSLIIGFVSDRHYLSNMWFLHPSPYAMMTFLSDREAAMADPIDLS